MPDPAFKLMMTIALLLITGISLMCLLQPSLYLRWFPNRFMPDTPWNRIQLRALGLTFCLFDLENFRFKCIHYVR